MALPFTITMRYAGPIDAVYDWFRLEMSPSVAVQGGQVDADDGLRRITWRIGSGKRLMVMTFTCTGDQTATTVTGVGDAPNAGRFGRGEMSGKVTMFTAHAMDRLGERWPAEVVKG